MNKRQNRPIPELEIPGYRKYLDWDDEDTERLMIPADVVLWRRKWRNAFSRTITSTMI